MKLWLLACVLVLSAPLALTQVAWAEEVYSVKGVALGMTEAEALAALGAAGKCGEAYDYTRDQGIGFDEMAKRVAERKAAGIAARNFLCRKEDGVQFVGGRDSFAERSARIRYNGTDYRISQITVEELAPHDFDYLVGVLTTKFGEPQIEVEPIQTRVGADYENRIARWNGGSKHAELIKFHGTVKDSQFRVWSDSWTADRAGADAARKSSGAKDL